jgi:hypothetical protein
MTTNTHRRRLTSIVVAGAVAVGVAAGSYGVASAASGSGSTSSSGSSTSAGSALAAVSASAPSARQPWGGQRPDETVQTGDVAAKISAAALAKVPGADIVRVETDADGNAKYEAHIVKSDGTPATVYVDASFNVVSVETR